MTPSRYLRARLRPAAVVLAVGMALLSACMNQVGGGSSKIPGASVYPLTGEPHANAIVAQRPPLSIKVDNVAGALPQAGLNQADLVVDTPVEGGLTRLFAVFQSQGADLVGPIRSARPVDATLLRLVGGGIFAYSGSSPLEIAPVKADSGATLLSWEADPQLFFLRSDHVSPHTVFSSTALLYGAVKNSRPARQVFSVLDRGAIRAGRPFGAPPVPLGTRRLDLGWQRVPADPERPAGPARRRLAGVHHQRRGAVRGAGVHGHPRQPRQRRAAPGRHRIGPLLGAAQRRRRSRDVAPRRHRRAAEAGRRVRCRHQSAAGPHLDRAAAAPGHPHLRVIKPVGPNGCGASRTLIADVQRTVSGGGPSATHVQRDATFKAPGVAS